MLLAQQGFSPDALAEWLKVLFFLCAGIAAVGVAIRQFAPRPPASDLDKELTRINGVIEKLTSQHGTLADHVKESDTHAEKCSVEIFSRLRELEIERGAIREATETLKGNVGTLDGKINRLLEKLNA